MRRGLVRLVLVVGICGAAGSALALSSSSDAGRAGVWLGPGGAVPFPAIVADGRLGFDAVWNAAGNEIATAHLSAVTGRWSTPVTLSGPAGQSQPQVAGSSSGAAAVSWFLLPSDGAPYTVQVRYRPSATGTWQPTVTLGTGALPREKPQVAIDARGDAVAAWLGRGGVRMSEHPAGASTWSAPALVLRLSQNSSSPADDLTLAGSSSGTIAMVWERYVGGSVLCCSSPGTRDVLTLAVRAAGQSRWHRANLGLDGTASGQGAVDPYTYGPQVTVNRGGTVFIASQWPHNGRYYARAAMITPADHWGRPRFAVTGEGLEPSIAAGDQGYSTVIWGGGPNGLLVADLSPRARLLRVRPLPGHGASPRLVDDGHGDLAGVWGESDYRPAHHSWCRPTPYNAGLEDNDVAIAPDGRGEIIWDQELGQHPGVRARALTSCRR